MIGAPDEEMGQRVLAVVQPDPAAHAAARSLTNCSPTAGSTWRVSNARARSPSATNCPAFRRGSSCGAGSVRTSQDARPVSSSAGQ
ncbi:hypothetical protein LUX39_08085 [Actinomadura madurae]|nr:hypothetical protein [Actinomadura madurae]